MLISRKQISCIVVYAAVSNGKRKLRQFSSIRFPFAHRPNGSLLFVRLFAKKLTKVIRWKTDYSDLTGFQYRTATL